ncbi:hypothetical protein BKA64DRAFT_771005 [Cadophora sp. MPI-SDFR-AT-0126]|nr:hypothetical protein BKA64DRAFT_771005 [Leotiomycetes sp. MPI-SDFR-AT-0126]
MCYYLLRGRGADIQKFSRLASVATYGSNMDSNFCDEDFALFQELRDGISPERDHSVSAKSATRRAPKNKKSTRGRKRSTRACEMCHKRKVRCNVLTQGTSCSNCNLDGIVCHIPYEYQRKNPKRKSASTQTTDIGSRSDASTISKNKTSNKENPLNVPVTSTVLLTSSEENDSVYEIFETFPPHLDAADLAYLHSRDSLTLPSESFQVALLSTYINFVHVKMPILDMRQFLAIVKRSNDGLDVDKGKNDNPISSNGKKISFLLFQVVLFAGVEYVGSEVLGEEGFESREHAQETLVNRVRLLYDFDTCTQRLAVIQSLLLMTYCPRNATRSLGFKDCAHWLELDLAISFAYTLGLNRQLEEERYSHRKKSLDRRIWWSLFI